MPLTRVVSGDFGCPECAGEFDAERMRPKDLVCPQCNVSLVEVPDEEPEEQEDESEDEEDP